MIQELLKEINRCRNHGGVDAYTSDVLRRCYRALAAAAEAQGYKEAWEGCCMDRKRNVETIERLRWALERIAANSKTATPQEIAKAALAAAEVGEQTKQEAVP